MYTRLYEPLFFKRGGVALDSVSIGMFPAQKGWVRMGQGPSFWESWWKDHPHSVLESVMQRRCK